MTGTVVAFDEYVGLGEVLSDGGERYPFHCTQISDGTRKIDVGASVTFEVVERHKGPEAYKISSVVPPGVQ